MTILSLILLAFSIWLYIRPVPEPRIDDAAYIEVPEKSDGADFVDPYCLEHPCKG